MNERLTEYLRRTRNTEGRFNLLGQQKPYRLAAMEDKAQALWRQHSEAVDHLYVYRYESPSYYAVLDEVKELARRATAADKAYAEALADFTVNPDKWWLDEMAEARRQELMDVLGTLGG